MMWIGYALLSAIFAAAVAIVGKIGLKNVDSTLATTIRAVVMAIFLLGIAAVLQKFSLLKTVGNQTLTFIIFSGVAALDRLSVVFVVILAAMFLGEALTFKSVSGLVLLVLGALLLVWK